MKNWVNGKLYHCRRIGVYPQIEIERNVHGKYRGLSIGFFEGRGGQGATVSITTRMAKLLVKRIKQCIEDK